MGFSIHRKIRYQPFRESADFRNIVPTSIPNIETLADFNSLTLSSHVDKNLDSSNLQRLQVDSRDPPRPWTNRMTSSAFSGLKRIFTPNVVL